MHDNQDLPVMMPAVVAMKNNANQIDALIISGRVLACLIVLRIPNYRINGDSVKKSIGQGIMYSTI